MSKHIIVGAGLGGLYTATRLINKGVDPQNLLIIDPRSGLYTRPGHISCDTFLLIGKKTGIETKEHSSTHHIKELERMMYYQLVQKGVMFVSEQFVDIQPEQPNQPKAVITYRANGSRGIYPADYVFDCTGREGSVAKAINNHQKSSGLEPVFTSTQLVDVNPIPDHIFAHVIIPNRNGLKTFVHTSESLFNNYDAPMAVPKHLQKQSAEVNIQERNKLLALGWPYELFPMFYFYPQEDKNKICLYMEAPPDLPIEKQKVWIELILTIYSRGKITEYQEIQPSKKYIDKPRLLTFKNQPHQLNQMIFQSAELPTVIIGFDALKGSDYRLGNGVTSGVECCEMMLNETSISNGKIQSFTIDKIEQNVFSYINGKYKEKLSKLLKSRQEAIESGCSYFYEIYKEALSVLPVSEQETKQDYLIVLGELAYKLATVVFPSLNEIQRFDIEQSQRLNICLILFLEAKRNTPANKTNVHHDINSKLNSLVYWIHQSVKSYTSEQVKNFTYSEIYDLKTLLKDLKEVIGELDGTFALHRIQNEINRVLQCVQQTEQNSFSFFNSSQTHVTDYSGTNSSLVWF